MKDDTQTAPKHLIEHEVPPDLHHHQDEATLLAQWLRKAIDKGPVYWLVPGLIVVGGIVLAVAVGNWTGKPSANSAAWLDLMLADTPEEQIKVAETPGPAAGWALLQAAEARYQEAFNDLPANREAALPLLTKAHDLFEQASQKSDADPMCKRRAALGMARALEARGDLEAAISQYEKVAKNFPSTPEASRAELLARELRKPENQKFYQNFASYKPTEMTLPPRGRGFLDSLPASHPPIDGPVVPAPGLDLPTLPPAINTTTPPAEPKAETEAAPKASTPEIPSAPFKDDETPKS
jgi:tetratricopeptide (TPR) repeat protein